MKASLPIEASKIHHKKAKILVLVFREDSKEIPQKINLAKAKLVVTQIKQDSMSLHC